MNFPLKRAGDADLLSLYKEELVPAAEAFGPGIILVSAGYDAHVADPLGTFTVTERGYAQLTAVLRDLAWRLCEGRLLLVLEGGYEVNAQARCVGQTLKVMMGHSL